MAFVADEAIRDCIAEVLVGTIAGVRAIPASTLSTDDADGATDTTHSLRAISIPTASVRVEYTPSPDRPQHPSNIWIIGISVTITYTHLLGPLTLLNDAYDDAKSTAATTADRVAQAFNWPGKLAATSDARATGIVSGVLQWEGTSVTRDQPPQSGQAAGGGIYQLTQNFSGSVLVSSAIA